jgi:hypothetical protein
MLSQGFTGLFGSDALRTSLRAWRGQWYARTAIEDISGITPELINDDRLYRGLDHLGRRWLLWNSRTGGQPASRVLL